MTNEAALLALIADLYKQVTALQADNTRLRAEAGKAGGDEK